jgi:hypothetical protein
MSFVLATLPMTHLLWGITPLVNLAVVFIGALYWLHRIRKRAPELANAVAVWLAPAVFFATGLGWIPLLKVENGLDVVFLHGFSHLIPDGMLAGLFSVGFGYLTARSAWSASVLSVRKAARGESVLFGSLLLLDLILSLWERLDWWWGHS